MKTTFEKMGGTYRQAGDYLLPHDEAPRRLKIHKNQVLTAFAAFC